MVKNLPVMQETQWRRSLGREDPLEKGMATHSNSLTWRTPGTEKPGGLQSCPVVMTFVFREKENQEQTNMIYKLETMTFLARVCSVSQGIS